MPIEIRELIIKTTVTEANGGTNVREPDIAFIQKLKKEILRECMEKIRRQERIKNSR